MSMRSLAALAVIVCFASPPLLAQSAPIEHVEKRVLVRSGNHDNPGTREVVVFQHLLTVPGAPWLRLRFEAANLPAGSYVEVASLLDGHHQRLDSAGLEAWDYTSAYFNGEALYLRLVAGPGARDASFTITSVWAGKPPAGPATICGNRDDRVPSNDKRVGRLMSVGCTAWLISSTNCFVTAGHCCGSRASVVQFNVPPSSSNGTPRNPPPQDQYPVDSASKRSQASGIGNDWCVFKTRANTTTGKHAGQVQGAFFKIRSVKPGIGASIRITGYGVTSPRNSRSQTQQTHAGPLRSNAGTRLCYHTDTTGGNSGSPVIDVASGEAVGVHTHGGCNTSPSSCNSGTSVTHTAFAAAIKAACGGGGGGTPGKYTFFGAGCRGTGGGGGSTCASLNGNGGTIVQRALPNEYSYGVRATRTLTVTGFQLYTQAVSTARTMTCALYGPTTSTVPPRTSIRRGTMTVGTRPGWYTVKFSSPITIPAGRNFWISQFDTNTVRAASLTSGQAPSLRTYWRRPAGSGTWFVTGIVRFPAWRVLCAGGGGGNAVPLLGNTGVPNIGKSFTLNLSLAKANTPAWLCFGASRTRWGSFRLPLDLAIIGAPGCLVLASCDANLGTRTSAGGTASWRVTIPNLKSLVGQTFYNQAIVADPPANRLGLVLTRAGAGTIGNQ